MIPSTAPFRVQPPKLRLKQSAPFISPRHRIHPQSPKTLLAASTSSPPDPIKFGRPRRTGEVGGEPGTLWHGKSQLSKWLEVYSPHFSNDPKPSPFLPRKVHFSTPFLPYSGQSPPQQDETTTVTTKPDGNIDPLKEVEVRMKGTWRKPLLGQSQRQRLCEEAFIWRLEYAAARPGWGGIESDPVPHVIDLLGGEHFLTPRDRRWMGLETSDSTFSVAGSLGSSLASLVRTLPSLEVPESERGTSTEEDGRDVVRLPVGFGRYKRDMNAPPFKGTLRERNKTKRVAAVREKMQAMPARIETYRRELKEGKLKMKPSLPF